MTRILYGNDEFRRRLSGRERLILRAPNANVVMVARIEGPLSEGELKSAVSKLRQRHPFLGVRVDLDGESVAWLTPEGVPDIPVQVIQKATDDEWIQTAIEQHKRPFTCETGPLVRFTLLTSRGLSDLIVVAHHAVCDGLSLAYLIRDCLRYLGEPDRTVESLPVPPPVDQYTMPDVASGNLLARLGTRLVNKSWEKKEITFDERDFQDLHRTFWQRHEGRMLAWALTESQTSALVSRCREENVTVNSALVTAFVAAQNEVQSSHERLNNVVVSVDYRNRLTRPVGEAFAFYASSVRPRLEYVPGESFWHVARTFHERIKDLLTDENVFSSQRLNGVHPSLLDGLVFAKYGKLDDKLAARLVERMGLNKVQASLLVTNLGRLTFPADYGPLHLAEMYGPYVYSDTVEKYWGVMTVGSRMYFTLCWGETIVDSDTVREVRDAAMNHLGKAVGW
jgi:NRPS condensation-like uncharacterized protein